MKNKKCPYCNRRISYFTVFHEKKHGLYKCERCKKESKIKTDFRLILSFIVLCLLIVLFMIYWNTSQFYNNILGVFIVIAALVLFYFSTPLFINFVPLKKYKNESKPHYSDNISEENPSEEIFEENSSYAINRDIFDKIKKERKAVTEEEINLQSKADSVVNSIKNEPYVPIIQDVSQAHASSDAPLQKKNRQPVYTDYEPEPLQEEVREYIPKKKMPDGTKYTANRRL